MRLVDRGADIVSVTGYKNWRETGIAFAEFDADYSQPNVTIISSLNKQGEY